MVSAPTVPVSESSPGVPTRSAAAAAGPRSRSRAGAAARSLRTWWTLRTLWVRIENPLGSPVLSVLRARDGGVVTKVLSL
jgi:hypothetical protein